MNDPDLLTVRRFPPDKALAAHGVDPLGLYPERYWLPVIGPTTLLLGRYLHRATEHHHDPVELSMEETAACIGVGGTGSRSPLVRSLERLTSFGIAAHDEQGDVTYLPDLWPPLAARQARRLPTRLLLELTLYHSDRAEREARSAS